MICALMLSRGGNRTRPSLDGTDRISRWFLAAPDGNTLSGFWWASTSGVFVAFAVVLLADGQWQGLLGLVPATWAGTRAVAQYLRGRLWR